MWTPMARNAANVASASSPSRNPLTRVVPLAKAPSIIERWEIDLSPGTLASPLIAPPGSILNCISFGRLREVLAESAEPIGSRTRLGPAWLDQKC